MNIPNFCVWYKLENEKFQCIKYIEGVRTPIIINNIRELKMNQFEYLPKKAIDRTIENLYKYSEDIIIWRNELLQCKSLTAPFDYFDNSFIVKSRDGIEDDLIYYRNHSNNVKTFIKKFVKRLNNSPIFDSFEHIELYEEKYFLKTNRAGLMYGKVGVWDMITYDFAFYFPSIMASRDYQIPTTKGKITQLKKIPFKFKYGIYNVKITSNDENFNKIFGFSSDNYYTHYSLNFVRVYNKFHGGNIELELLSFECLLYDENELITGYDIFNCWYNRLKEVKQELPKNGLVKKLGSTSWGELQSQKHIIMTEDEIEVKEPNLALEMDEIDENTDYFVKNITILNDGKGLYKLIPLKNEAFYNHQLRMKSFITDFSRVRMAKAIIKGGMINNVVRIQTDSVSYTDLNNKVVPHNEITLKIDTKKTGVFNILNNRTVEEFGDFTVNI